MVERPSYWRWWVCGLLLLATMIMYMDRQTLANVAVRIQWEFGLSNQQYGTLELVFSIAFATGALVFGFLSDRFNVFWLYPVALGGWSLAGIATGLADNYDELLLCRTMLGLFEAGNWPCALKTTQLLLNRADRTMGNSVLQSGASVGAVATPLLMVAMLSTYSTGVWQRIDTGYQNGHSTAAITQDAAQILSAQRVLGAHVNTQRLEETIGNATRRLAVHPDQSSAVLAKGTAEEKTELYVPGAWRSPFQIIGILGAGWILLWVFSMRRSDFIPTERTDAPPKGQKLSAVLADRRFRVLMCMVICINVPWQLIRAWLPKFLQDGRGYSETFTLLFNSAYYIATDIGCLAAGAASLWLVRKRGWAVHAARQRVYGVCAALVALMAVAAFLPQGWLLLGLLLVIAAASLGMLPCYYSFTQEISQEHQGKITGILGASAWVAIAPCQPLFGWFVDRTGNYNLGLAITGCMPLVAFVVLATCWPASHEKTSPVAPK
ncbi:MAG: MFS transporter [Pedosphaera sp.]|nr:MFS transporter [Pedosphaera sp.]MSU44499.1 MFS transporter [Pedosphaera sp.]